MGCGEYPARTSSRGFSDASPGLAQLALAYPPQRKWFHAIGSSAKPGAGKHSPDFADGIRRRPRRGSPPPCLRAADQHLKTPPAVLSAWSRQLATAFHSSVTTARFQTRRHGIVVPGLLFSCLAGQASSPFGLRLPRPYRFALIGARSPPPPRFPISAQQSPPVLGSALTARASPSRIAGQIQPRLGVSPHVMRPVRLSAPVRIQRLAVPQTSWNQASSIP